MAWKTITVNLIGESPLLCHNGQMADPMNEFAKKLKVVTSKKPMTDEDHEEKARLEWRGGLYVDDQGYPVIPGEIIEAAIVSGAKKKKKGKEAKAAIAVNGNCRITNGGADLSNLDQLFQNQEYRHFCMVRVQKNKVGRTRPIFNEWSLNNVKIDFDGSYLNEDQVIQALKDEMAIGDWRPKFGRFRVEVVNQV